MQNLFISSDLEVHQLLNKLHYSLRIYFWEYLKERGEIDTQATSYRQNELIINRRYWETPGQNEFKLATIIRKQMKELLRQESLIGMETSRKQLLVDVFGYLWKYFLFHGREGGQRAVHTSHFYEQERPREFAVGVLKDDCEVVAHILQQQTGLLDQSGSCEEVNKRLHRILWYLRQRTRHTQHTSYEEDKELEKLDWILR